MNNQKKLIFKEVLEKIKPSKKELDEIKNLLKNFLENLNREKEKEKVNASIFIGGSFAKKTLIKKDKYDIDIFLRFNSQHKKEDISKLTYNLMKNFENLEKIHGSRDYFRIKMKNNLFFEIVPVLEIKKLEEAENITDLSYFHVNFINKKIKNPKILDEIMITKAFCYANNCYGAESYINGFSGYSLELLIYYYGSFLKFIKNISKINSKKIIDPGKLHKTKKDILINLNSSKLKSPLILIDPTNKQRNALAALSKETFDKFQKKCNDFLINPSIISFEKSKIDFEKIKKKAKKGKLDFILLKDFTFKQGGNIAGSKLLKFHKYLYSEISKFFFIKNSGFFYEQRKSAKNFFIIKPKKEILFEGPFLKDKQNLKKFEKVHKKTFKKMDKIYAKEKINFNIENFIKNWKRKNKKQIKEMGIHKIQILDI